MYDKEQTTPGYVITKDSVDAIMDKIDEYVLEYMGDNNYKYTNGMMVIRTVLCMKLCPIEPFVKKVVEKTEDMLLNKLAEEIKNFDTGDQTKKT